MSKIGKKNWFNLTANLKMNLKVRVKTSWTKKLNQMIKNHIRGPVTETLLKVGKWYGAIYKSGRDKMVYVGKVTSTLLITIKIEARREVGENDSKSSLFWTTLC